MVAIERLEKGGRLVLWLAMASAVVLVPIAYINQQVAQVQLAEAARKEALQKQEAFEKAKEEAEKSDRISLDSMGPHFTVLDESRGAARIWFSNVSPRTGVVCVTGLATSPARNMSTFSLATCERIAPYASNVKIQVEFAGELAALCKGTPCTVAFKDAPEVGAPTEVAAAAP